MKVLRLEFEFDEEPKLMQSLLLIPLFLTIYILSFWKISQIVNNDSLIYIYILFVKGYFFSDAWQLLTIKYLKLDGIQRINGRHIHHSVLALAALFVGVIGSFTYDYKFLLYCIVWGIGVLVQHSFTYKRFEFFSKDRSVHRHY